VGEISAEMFQALDQQRKLMNDTHWIAHQENDRRGD
jgi:hypothetical protein